MSVIADMQVLEAQSDEHLQAILKCGDYSKPITVISMQT